MKLIALLLSVSVVLISGCGPTGPLPIQSTTSNGNTIVINYDPNQRTNAQMRALARSECKKRGLVLNGLTVTKTESKFTSQATVICV